MIHLVTVMNRRKIFDEEQLYEYIMESLDKYERLGPLIGISLPLIEAILPILPIIVFVFVNIAAFGLVKGFLYSWIGSTLGSIVVFSIFRRLGNRRLFRKIRGNKQVKKITQWMDRRGFGLIFLLLCFPFSPSAIINIVAGLSKVHPQQFILAVILGKAVMIFSISYIGENILSFAENPTKTIIVGISIVIFWLVGKQVENILQKRAGKTKGDL